MKRLLLLLPFCLIGCASNVSKNKVTTSSLSLKAAFLDGKNHVEQLTLQRISWYQELTMMYDFWYGEIAPNSPFLSWAENPDSYRHCQKVFLGLHYSLNLSKIPHSKVISQLELAGLQLRKDRGMESHLRLHPDYENYSLALYDIYLYCYQATGPVGHLTTITLPEFSPANLDLNPH